MKFVTVEDFQKLSATLVGKAFFISLLLFGALESGSYLIESKGNLPKESSDTDILPSKEILINSSTTSTWGSAGKQLEELESKRAEFTEIFQKLFPKAPESVEKTIQEIPKSPIPVTKSSSDAKKNRVKKKVRKKSCACRKKSGRRNRT